MTRDEFMEIVYDELANDPDNSRANRIIEAFDMAMDLLRDTEWIPITYRKADEDELDGGYEYMLTCPLPEEHQEVLVSIKGKVYADTIVNYDGWSSERFGDLRDIDAWLPLPKPYKEGANDD